MTFREGGYTLLNEHLVPENWLNLFKQAWERLQKFGDLHNKKSTIVFAVNGSLTIKLTTKERIAECWRDLIIYNVDEMKKRTEKEIEVILLEELVHCYFDSFDESAVGLLVASQVPGIGFDTKTGQYVDRANDSK